MSSQFSLERHLARRRSDYNHALFAAAPAPEGAPVAVGTGNLPNPFPVLKTETTEARFDGQPCARCFGPLGSRGLLRPLICDQCGEAWHLDCAGRCMPPSRNSWCCHRCEGSAMPPLPARVKGKSKPQR